MEGDLSRYRKLIEELAAGQLDGESFGRRTRGTRLGVVVDGDALWLYDARHERWCYCDGVSLQTYAVTAGPSSRSGERQGAGRNRRHRRGRVRRRVRRLPRPPADPPRHRPPRRRAPGRPVGSGPGPDPRHAARRAAAPAAEPRG